MQTKILDLKHGINGIFIYFWIVLASVSLFFDFSTCQAQSWVSNGPYGGSINAMAVHPSNPNLVFAGTDRGLFKSEDGGVHWKETRITDWIGDILFDPSDPNIVYAGGGSGFHKSFDGGKKWFTSGGQGGINDIAIDPSNPKIIYAATEDGVYQSIDGGGFWGKLGLYRAGSVAVHPTNSDIIYAGTRPAGPWRPGTGHEFHGAIYKSVDGGENWKLIYDPGEARGESDFNSHVDCLVIDPQVPDTVYAGTRWGHGLSMGLYKSTDSGASWEKIWIPGEAGGPNIHFILFDKKDTKNIYVGADSWGLEGIHQSADGGSSWSRFTQEISVGVRDMAISPSNPNIIYIATASGVQKSADGGVSWNMMNEGIKTLYVRYVAVSKDGFLYAASNTGIHKSVDGGSTWNRTSLIDHDAFQILPDPSHKEAMYAASTGGPNASGTVYKSFDSGGSWWGSARGFNGGAASIAVAPSQPNIIYGGSHGDAYVYRSTDSGASWKEMRVTDELGRQPRHVHSLAVDAVDPNIVYASMYRDVDGWGIYKSTNGGESWNTLITGLCDGWDRPQRIAAHPITPDVIYLAACDGVNKSENGGKSWQIVGMKGQGVQAITFDPNNPNILYAGADRTVYQSLDGGNLWTELGVLDAYIRSITPDPYLSGVVYAATDNGVYIYKESGDLTPPAIPKDVQVTLEGTKATISWTANTEADLAAYKVYIGAEPRRYDKPVLAEETSYSFTIQPDKMYYIAVSAYDMQRNESRPSEEVRLGFGVGPMISSFTLELRPGLHMVSLPLSPIKTYTARMFAEMLKASLVVEYDEELAKFSAYLPTIATTDGFTIKGGHGYIVNVPEAKKVTFTGAAWASAPALTQTSWQQTNWQFALHSTDTLWAFAVGGLLPQGIEADQLTLLNPRNGWRAQAESQGVGRFGAVLVGPPLGRGQGWVGAEGESVVAFGDVLEIRWGERVIAQHRISRTELRLAYGIVRLGERLPSQTRLLPNYPNPFNPETWIPYELAESADVTIQIYDVQGHLVRTFSLGYQAAGVYTDKVQALHWDGRNQLGERVSGGVYFYQLNAGTHSIIRRMVMVK